MARRFDPHASVRERLLAAADALFYEHGVNTVGIDRVIEQAGVAKASLYSAFGRKERMTRMLEQYPTPRERVLGVFDVLGELFVEPGFHGCAFVNASAEASPDSPIQEAAAE